MLSSEGHDRSPAPGSADPSEDSPDGAERDDATAGVIAPSSGASSGALSGGRLEQVLERYMEELAAGAQPDQEAYLRAHPELAEALRGIFRTLDFVEATSRSLNTSQLEKDQRLGDYRIVGEIGRGGMGVVYEAVQVSLDRRVALKILPHGALLSGTAPERFMREAGTAGRLHHSNIVPVYAFGEEDGIPFYAMQYIRGCSLADHLAHLRESGQTPGPDFFRRVATWGRQAAEALAYAHEQGVIHRDIKPSNLLLDDRDNVWVTDFGLARSDSHLTITVPGDLVGTARYMSPEQARGGGRHVTERSDIHALGATLYEALALEPAYEGASREDVLNRITGAQPKPLRQVNGAIPRDLETIVAKCMEKQAARRYATAEEVAEDCRRFLAGESIRARRTPWTVKAWRWGRRHRWRVTAIAVVAVLLMVLAGGVLAYRRDLGQRYVDDAYDALLFEHDLDKTSVLLDRAHHLGVDSAELHLGLGLIPLMSAQPQRAISHLDKALQRDPEQVEANYAMAYAYFTVGDEVRALRYFQQVDETSVTTALGWLLRGYGLDAGEAGDALEAYNNAIALQSDFTPAIEARAHYRADRLIIDGDRSQLQPMLDDFNAWVIFWPESSGSYAARAAGRAFAAAYAGTQDDLRHLRDEWITQSFADLDRAMELKRGNPAGLLVRRGAYLRYLGDFEQSAEVFGRAIELDRQASGERHPGYVHHHALALHAIGRIAEALDEIEPACEALPNFFPLAVQRAILLAELGRLDEAREVARAAIAEQSGSETGVVICAAVLHLLGDEERATAAVSAFAARGDAASPTLAYLRDPHDPAPLLEAVGDHPGRRCAATFLIAMCELGQGNRAEGMRDLQACIDTGVFTYVYHRFAQIFLMRAETDPDWPVWIPARP